MMDFGRRWFVPGLLCALGSVLLAAPVRAGSLDGAKLALHAKAKAAKAVNVCPGGPASEDPLTQGIPCSLFSTSFPVGQGADVYLVAARGDPEAGFAGIECGIDYDPLPGSGVDVFGWQLCSDLDFPSAGWPGAGSGNRITWSPISNCQLTRVGSDGVHAVAGAFYAYAYTDDVFRLTPNNTVPPGPQINVADCASAETPLTLDDLGSVGFGSSFGCNPCLPECGQCPEEILAVSVEDGAGLYGERTSTTAWLENLTSQTVQVSLYCTVDGVAQPVVTATLSAGETVSREVLVDCAGPGPTAVQCRADATMLGAGSCSRSSVTTFTVECIDPRPAIASVLDVPGDQGGWVTLAVDASPLDPPAYPAFDPITLYSVWQKADGFAKPALGRALEALPASPSLGSVAPPPGLPVSSFGGRTILFSAEGLTDVFPPGTWALLGGFAATASPSYSVLAPTLADSTDSASVPAEFVVTAHTAIASRWYASLPGSGFSRDNLPPAMPGNLALSVAGILTWDPPVDPDFNYFTVYGAPASGSSPAVTLEILGYTTDTRFDTRTAGDHDSYEVTATDFAGNEGPPAGVEPVPVRLAYFTAQREGEAAVLRWKALEETGLAGFHVFRRVGEGERERLTDALLVGGEHVYRDPLPPPVALEYWLQEVGREGETAWHGPALLAALKPAELPLWLARGRPNPFRDRTRLTFRMPAEGRAVLRILDVSGREVARPFDAWTGAGEHEAWWDGRGEGGDPAPAGVYFTVLAGAGDTVTRKLVKVR